MSKKPQIKKGPASQHEHGDQELIREIFDPVLKIGALISIRRTDAGNLIIEVYRKDAGIISR